MIGQEPARGHPQRAEDPVAGELLPGPARSPFEDHPRRQEHQVVVLPGAAEVAARRQVPQRLDRVEPCPVRAIPDPVVPGQSGAVRHQVARGGAVGGHRVLEQELGHDLAHRLIPVELLRVRQHPQPGDGERLRDRGDRKERLRRDRELLLAVAQAVALEVNQLIVPDHRQRQPRDLPVLHGGRNEGTQPIQLRPLDRHRLGTAGRRPRGEGRECDGPGELDQSRGEASSARRHGGVPVRLKGIGGGVEYLLAPAGPVLDPRRGTVSKE